MEGKQEGLHEGLSILPNFCSPDKSSWKELGLENGRGGASGSGDMDHSRREETGQFLKPWSGSLPVRGTCVWSLPTWRGGGQREWTHAGIVL